MQYRPSFADQRYQAFCVFCGGTTGTRDHCPSRVFLDKPYPNQLPVIPACAHCNSGFSKDEQYLACLISCVLAGSVEIEKIERPKIKRILSENPPLRSRLEKSRSINDAGIVFEIEHDRILSVVLKLAQGHAFFELSQRQNESPEMIWAVPLFLLSDEDKREFESPESGGLAIWPEVGSRAMMTLIENMPIGFPWMNVQDNRYRYHVSYDSGTTVRIVIHDYLACFVYWNE
jgi:hypothetical protein